MAKSTTNAVSISSLSASEQLAHYRRIAKELSPQKADSTLALTLGSTLAAVPSFFGDVAAVYKAKRAEHDAS